MTGDIFSRHRFSPALLDDEFARGLYRLARHRILKGGLPSQGTRYEDGFLLGQWLYRHQVNPHALTELQRAYLLSVPGVRLSAERRLMTPRSLLEPTPGQVVLWDRISTWACPEGVPERAA